jgi:hypothetical protein
MSWTPEQKLESLLRLPWTIATERTPEGDRLLRVVEIPSAVGCGATPAEAESDLWESLRASLSAYLHFEDAIPLPRGTDLPWRARASNVTRTISLRLHGPGEVGAQAGGESTGGAADWAKPTTVPA